MIVQSLMDIVFSFIDFLLSLLPDVSLEQFFSVISNVTGITEIIKYGSAFFPVGLWTFFIGNVVFWKTILIGWACIEWLYKKIPGVD